MRSGSNPISPSPLFSHRNQKNTKTSGFAGLGKGSVVFGHQATEKSPHPNDSPRLLRADAVGRLFSLSGKTIKNLANRKLIRGYKVHSQLWLFDPEEVEPDLRSMAKSKRDKGME